MHRYVKYGIAFIGGMTVGGTMVVKALLKDENTRNGLKIGIADKIDELLYGKKAAVWRPNRTSYRSYYEDYEIRTRYFYDDIIFESRTAAQECLDQMNDYINVYGFVSVANMYELADMSKKCTIDMRRYGWKNLMNAKVTRVRDGYILNLPRTMRID